MCWTRCWRKDIGQAGLQRAHQRVEAGLRPGRAGHDRGVGKWRAGDQPADFRRHEFKPFRIGGQVALGQGDHGFRDILRRADEKSKGES